MKKDKIASYIVNAVAIAALFILGQYMTTSGMLSRYYTGIVMMVGINIILTASLNLTTGYLGQLALGRAGFMSVGAYGAALFTLYSGLPTGVSFPIALFIGGIVAALFGIAIGIPALRLKGDYLAIITLGFGEIIRVLITNVEFTGGAKGLRGIPRITNFAYVYIVAVITLIVLYTLLRSRQGRAIISIREDEIAAEASGINTTYYKLLAFTISAFFAGVAGGLYAHYLSVLDPANFDFNYSIEILVMVVLGGTGFTDRLGNRRYCADDTARAAARLCQRTYADILHTAGCNRGAVPPRPALRVRMSSHCGVLLIRSSPSLLSLQGGRCGRYDRGRRLRARRRRSRIWAYSSAV